MRRVRESEYSIVLLDWTIPMISRFRLAAAAKARNHATAVVVLHASGALNNPNVDAAVDTRAGVEQILTALNEAQRQLSLRAHGHTELDSEYVCRGQPRSTLHIRILTGLRVVGVQS